MKKYLQLYSELRSSITSGKYPALSKLPTEQELSLQYGLSRQTVRQALSLLRDEGYISSVKGSGSFVAPLNQQPIGEKRIAVITTYLSEYIFPSILRGISDAAIDQGYMVELNTTNNSLSLEKKILLNLHQHSVAGLIVEGTKSALPNPNIAHYKALAESGIPIVFINSFYSDLEESNVVSVTVDDYGGGYVLAQRLIEQGHRDIGCIFKSDDSQGINRFAGVIAAFADNDINFNDRHFFWFSTETKYSLVPPMCSSQLFSSCTALICYNDEIAEMISTYLRNSTHNIKSIVSFDGKINRNIFPDSLDFFSLIHPKEQLGKIAADKLFNLISGQEEHSTVLPWNKEPTNAE